MNVKHLEFGGSMFAIIAALMIAVDYHQGIAYIFFIFSGLLLICMSKILNLHSLLTMQIILTIISIIGLYTRI